jgi:hypothetical protein
MRTAKETSLIPNYGISFPGYFMPIQDEQESKKEAFPPPQRRAISSAQGNLLLIIQYAQLILN